MLTEERENCSPDWRTCDLEPVAIFTRQRGALVDPAGIELGRSLERTLGKTVIFPPAAMTGHGGT